MLPPLSQAELKVSAAPDPDPHAEDRACEAQKMEALGRATAGATHDFNNLLTAINGFADLALDRLPPDDPVREFVWQIRRAGESATLLNQQLATFARPTRARPPIDLNTLVHELVPIIDRVVGPDVAVAVVLAPDLWATGAEHARVEQVLLDLCARARDTMPRGGQLRIETVNVEPEEPGAGRCVRLVIADTGRGMIPGDQNKLFGSALMNQEPARVLAPVFAAVQRIGGRVTISSVLGRGSTFNVDLPVAQGPEPDGTC